MKVREMLWLLLQDGWQIVRQKGSHRQMHHPRKQGTVTLSGHPGSTIRPGTLKAIFEQAQMRRRK